jgi:hypothetical protein
MQQKQSAAALGFRSQARLDQDAGKARTAGLAVGAPGAGQMAVPDFRTPKLPVLKLAAAGKRASSSVFRESLPNSAQATPMLRNSCRAANRLE